MSGHLDLPGLFTPGDRIPFNRRLGRPHFRSDHCREETHFLHSRCAYRVLVHKPERKGPLRRPRNRQEGNIKMNLKEIR
jgi:hypothetical protein